MTLDEQLHPVFELEGFKKRFDSVGVTYGNEDWLVSFYDDTWIHVAFVDDGSWPTVMEAKVDSAAMASKLMWAIGAFTYLTDPGRVERSQS